jgi:hypothetical protein
MQQLVLQAPQQQPKKTASCKELDIAMSRGSSCRLIIVQ